MELSKESCNVGRKNLSEPLTNSGEEFRILNKLGQVNHYGDEERYYNLDFEFNGEG